MSRAWHIEYEGACYHLLSRGNEGQDIFIGEQDRTECLNNKIEKSRESHKYQDFGSGQNQFIVAKEV